MKSLKQVIDQFIKKPQLSGSFQAGNERVACIVKHTAPVGAFIVKEQDSR